MDDAERPEGRAATDAVELLRQIAPQLDQSHTEPNHEHGISDTDVLQVSAAFEFEPEFHIFRDPIVKRLAHVFPPYLCNGIRQPCTVLEQKFPSPAHRPPHNTITTKQHAYFATRYLH